MMQTSLQDGTSEPAVDCGVPDEAEVYDDEAAGLDDDSRLTVVQTALHPIEDESAEWSMGVCWRAAAEISGDLANWATSPDGRFLTVTLGDVMGKGAPAGLLAAHLLGALDALERESPAVATDGAETAIRGRLERASAFATLFHGRLQLCDGALEFVDAGHGFAAIGRRDGEAERITSTDLPIGLQPSGMPRLPRHRMIGAGDVLLLASDGLLELPNASFDTLTTLAQHLARCDDIAEAFSDVVRAAPAVLEDDLTLLAVRRPTTSRRHDGSERPQEGRH